MKSSKIKNRVQRFQFGTFQLEFSIGRNGTLVKSKYIYNRNLGFNYETFTFESSSICNLDFVVSPSSLVEKRRFAFIFPYSNPLPIWLHPSFAYFRHQCLLTFLTSIELNFTISLWNILKCCNRIRGWIFKPRKFI